MAHPRIQHHIRKYFEDHAGVTVYRTDLLDYIEKVSNNRPTDGGVVQAIRKIADTGMDIKVIDQANSWRYQPEASNSKKADRELFERVYITKNDHWILEDSRGEVTIVKPVDL
jgi:aminopeptidase N